VFSVAFSPDGNSIVSGSFDHTIRVCVWDLQSGDPTSTPFEGHTKSVTSVLVSLDSTHVISTSSDNTIRFWDLKTGMRKASPLADEYTKDIISASFSPDGIRIAAASSHGTVGLWDVASLQLVSCIKSSINGVTSLSFSPDGTQLILNCVGGPTWTWNPTDGTLTETCQSPAEEKALFFDMKQGWSDNGTDDALLRWWPSDNPSVGFWAYVDGKVIRSNGRGSLTIVDTRTAGAYA
jgi:WD40 repeat protein